MNALRPTRRPFRWRTWLRERLPFWAIRFVRKGGDCIAAGGRHDWYNRDGARSACYHCRVTGERGGTE